MACPRCGDTLPATAAICGRCGLAVASYVAPVQKSRAKTLAVIGAIVAGVLLAGATTYVVVQSRTSSAGSFVAKTPSSNIDTYRAQGSLPEMSLNVTSRAPTSDLSAVARASGPDLQAEGQIPDAPSTQVTATAPDLPAVQVSAKNDPAPIMQIPVEAVAMPDDVRKWLEHLERCEKERLALATSQLTSAFSSMAHMQADDVTSGLDPDQDDSQETANKRVNARAENYAQSTDGMRQSWIQLTAKFNSVRPPAECESIRNSYDDVLSGTGGMMMEIVGTVRSAAQNREGALAKLMAMQGKSSDKIDKPARDADSGVGSVCRKYETKKWFDIKSDIGGGIMSKLGM